MIKMISAILSFKELQGKIAYNPTIPFEYNGRKYIGIRLEPLESELESQTFFAFEQDRDKNLWIIDYSVGSLQLQDPALMRIKGKCFLAGVKVWEENGRIRMRQDFYKGDSIKDLKYYCSGPLGMKDIRLVDLEDRIGVFTRPQGKIWGKGKIGYLELGSVDELQELSETDWCEAQIIQGLFNDGQWGGVNQAIKLPSEEIGVIGHVAHQTINKQDELEKHYYGMSFKFSPNTKKYRDFKIIAKRNNFPQSQSKKSPELDDVIFPSGIDESDNLYCGLSDFCIGRRKITNPF